MLLLSQGSKSHACACTGVYSHLPWEYELAIRQQVDKLPPIQHAQVAQEDEENSELSQEARRALADDPFTLDVAGWLLGRVQRLWGL